MKILLDNNMNPRVYRFLSEQHEVNHAYHLGWERLRNGDLIRSAEAVGYDLLLTTDTGIIYQQNNEQRRLSLIILPANSWRWLHAAHRRIVDAVQRATPGSYARLELMDPDDPS